MAEASRSTTCSNACLILLPTEILQLIFGYLTPSILASHIDLACKLFPTLTPDVYRRWYGKIYTHYNLNASKPNWKRMALEKERYNTSTKNIRSPAEVTTEILHHWYLASNDSFMESTADFILSSHRAPEQQTPAWFEAMATVLMAQGDQNEAQDVYSRLLAVKETLPERTWLTAARFGWPFMYSLLQNPSSTILGEASLGAATAQDLQAVQDLEARGVDLSRTYLHNTVATVAAYVGSLPILRYLQGRGIDILLAPREVGDTPLHEAASEGYTEVVHFLLETARKRDTDYRVEYPVFASALYSGYVDILKLLMDHTPGLATPKEGELVLGGCLERMENPTRTIKYLCEEAHMDINAVDKLGRRLVHLVAAQGNLALVKLLHDLGADLRIEDKTGQTPQEMASTAGHVGLTTWLTARTGEITQPRAIKHHLALELIAMLRDDDI